MNEEIKDKLRRGLALTVKESWDLYKYIKTLDNELKAYREADEEINRKMKSGQWSDAVVYGMGKALLIMRNHIGEVKDSEKDN